jgi:glycosyltransferase involved in cell wall biosynthesis
MPAISVAIIAKDEAERLRPCVESCRPFADEVVVIDSGSSDGTQALARELGCVVVESEWKGYGPQRNVAAANAAHDWIFWIDADEVVDAELAASIGAWKAGSGAGPSAFEVERVGDFFGRWMPGAAEKMTRLYDRRVCRVSDDVVHERVIGCGAPGPLTGRLWHFGFRSLSDHTVRFDRYTTLESEKAWDGGARFSWFRLLWRPPARFLHVLFRRGMYREGAAGVAIAFLWLQYDAMSELKLREREWARKGRPHDPVP